MRGGRSFSEIFEHHQSWAKTVSVGLKEVHLDALLIRRAQDPRPFLQVDVSGVPLIGLLDSGAFQTVLGHLGWKKLKKLNLKLTPVSTQIVVADGSSCTVLGKVTLPLKLDDKLIFLDTEYT